jgi:methionine-rich copper-binding protein CopC
MKRILLSLGFIALVLALAFTGLVQAHPRLRAADSSPAPGQILSKAPAQVKLSFNVEEGGLVVDQSFVWVYKQEGEQVIALGKVDTANKDRNTMLVTLPANLDAGIYIVKWVAISVSDKGFSEGTYSFAVTGK